jgi:hypothetical protein
MRNSLQLPLVPFLAPANFIPALPFCQVGLHGFFGDISLISYDDERYVEENRRAELAFLLLGEPGT